MNKQRRLRPVVGQRSETIYWSSHPSGKWRFWEIRTRVFQFCPNMQVVNQSRNQKRILVSVKWTNQTKLYLEITDILIDFCKWSLPLLNTSFISMEKSKNTNLSCFFRDQSKNLNPNAQTEVCHSPPWPGEGGRGKSKFSSPFPPHFCLIISFTAVNTCEQPLPQWDFTASLPPHWPNTDVLKQHFTFYKKNKPKYKPCEYTMREWGRLPSSCIYSFSLRFLKSRAKPKISWHLKASRFGVV